MPQIQSTGNSLARVGTGQLKVGMYVKMSSSWSDHPFLRNEFLLSSANQIEKIISHGIAFVLVDVDKSQVPVVPAPAEQPGEAHLSADAPSILPDNQHVVPNDLYSVIHDPMMPSAEKARLVRDNSLLMMKGLLVNPTANNIRESKKAIAEIVTFILKDNDAANYLIKITDHDYYTYTHSVNVGFWAVALAKELFRDSYVHNLQELGSGFFLHDIGKVRIDQAIITKPGRLSEEEMAEMRRHPAHGFRILDEANQLTEESRIIVLQHHERCDGKGYPRGLRGNQIHIYAKICLIADIFDALTSNRPYRKGSTIFDALKIMRNEMSGHFEPEFFVRFVRMFAIAEKG